METLHMRSNFKSLKEVFKNERLLSGVREIVESSDVIVDFYEMFPNLEKVAIPQTCEKKVLKLKVENPSWRNELKFMESEMIEKINNHFNEKRINQIRFIG
jgi:Dna[CI] antecedent, DciA